MTGAKLWAGSLLKGFVLTELFSISKTKNSGFRNQGEVVILAQVKMKTFFLSVIAQVGKLIFCYFNKWAAGQTCNV